MSADSPEWPAFERLALVTVRLFHNLRLLKRMNKPNYSEPAIGWTDDVDHTGVRKYNAASVAPSGLLKHEVPAGPLLPIGSADAMHV